MTQLCPQCKRDNRATGRFCAYCKAQLIDLLGTGSVLQGRYQVSGLLGCDRPGFFLRAPDAAAPIRRRKVGHSI